MLVYCTVDDVKGYVSLASRFTTTLDSIIADVSGRFNTYMRRDLEKVTNFNEQFDTPYLSDYTKSFSIWLLKRNITVNTLSLVVAQDRDFSGDYATILDASQFSIDLLKGKITIFGPLPKTTLGLRATYTGGYGAMQDHSEVLDGPAELRQACIEQVGYELDRKTNLFGGTNESARDTKGGKKAQPVVGFTGFLPQIQAVLDRYKKPL